MTYDSTWLNWRKLIIADRDLHFYSKSLALYLSTFMNDSHDMAFPSLRRIEHEMRVSRKTVIKYLGELEAFGYIQKGQLLNPKTTQLHNTYTALVPDSKNPFKGGGGRTPPQGEVVDLREGGGGSQGQKVVEDVHPNNQGNNQRNIQDIGENSKVSTGNGKVPLKHIVDKWNSFAETEGLPQVVKATTQLQGQIRQRWKDIPTIEQWDNFFETVRCSDFLAGRAQPGFGRSKPFRATLLWITKETNFAKIAAGEYE